LDQSQDQYYQNNIFPRVENHEIPFNWYAALGGPFWFAYKGMWKEWRFFYIPLACALVLLHAFGLIYSKYLLVFRVVMLLLVAFVAWHSGKVANYNYFVFFKRKSSEVDLNQRLRGITALMGILVLTGSLFYLTSDYFSLIKLRGAQLVKQSKQDFEIANYSMFPTFLKGDMVKFDLFVDRVFIGDVVLVSHQGQNIVMRVVALEDDVVEVVQGRVKLNGAELRSEEKKIDFFQDITPVEFAGVNTFKVFQETNENAVYFTYSLKNDLAVAQLKVGAGRVFLMADQRDAGPVSAIEAPLADIIGVYIP
jgi:signal peptidase I